MRDTARAPQPPTDPPTGHRKACMAWPKSTKNANFGPNLVVFGQKILFLLKKSKVLLPTKRKTHLGTLFTLFFGQHWTKCAKNGNIWPKMTKNADFGPNLAVFGPKILIFMGVSKSFGTNITENHQDNLSALFFGQALDRIGEKCRYLAQNASFGPNLAIFGPQIQFFGGRE